MGFLAQKGPEFKKIIAGQGTQSKLGKKPSLLKPSLKKSLKKAGIGIRRMERNLGNFPSFLGKKAPGREPIWNALRNGRSKLKTIQFPINQKFKE